MSNNIISKKYGEADSVSLILILEELTELHDKLGYYLESQSKQLKKEC